MDDNWCALFVATQIEVTPEVAFELLKKKPQVTKLLNDNDVADMATLKSRGLTYKQIGSIYHISNNAVYRRIKRFNERM